MAASKPRDSASVPARERGSLEAAVVARRYYLDGIQKSEIAAELGISRFKVARLLDLALAQGTVRITIDLPAEIDVEIGEKLAAKYGIARCIVARTIAAGTQVNGPLIGAACAQLLADILEPNDVLGISWGSTLTHVVDAISSLPSCDLVQLVGGISTVDLNVNGVELLRRMSAKTGGRTFPLHAPLLVRSAAVARELRLEPGIGTTTALYPDLTVALVGVGAWNSAKSTLFTELSGVERQALVAAGATADVCTFVLDRTGRQLNSTLLEGTVGISMDELRAVPTVVAVAGGSEKVEAISAVLASGIIGILVTDSITAVALIARD